MKSCSSRPVVMFVLGLLIGGVTVGLLFFYGVLSPGEYRTYFLKYSEPVKVDYTLDYKTLDSEKELLDTSESMGIAPHGKELDTSIDMGIAPHGYTK